MRYLKTYESHNIKQQIIDGVNQTIDDAVRSLEDEGFVGVKTIPGYGEGGSGYDIFKKYTRKVEGGKKTIGFIQLNGEINDGVIDWSDNEYEHFDHDIVQVFLNALSLMNGISGINIMFSFTNHYDEDKILIYTNV